MLSLLQTDTCSMEIIELLESHSIGQNLEDVWLLGVFFHSINCQYTFLKFLHDFMIHCRCKLISQMSFILCYIWFYQNKWRIMLLIRYLFWLFDFEASKIQRWTFGVNSSIDFFRRTKSWKSRSKAFFRSSFRSAPEILCPLP